MLVDRQKVCPKCRAFVHRKMNKCPYCGRPLDSKPKRKERCRLCGCTEVRVLPLTDEQPGPGKRATRKVCANCGKDL